MHKHVEFAVNWHVISWVKCANKFYVIIVVAVTRKVDTANAMKMRFAVANNFATLAHETINCSYDVLFVAWNGT